MQRGIEKVVGMDGVGAVRTYKAQLKAPNMAN